jgi:hypothetical protein
MGGCFFLTYSMIDDADSARDGWESRYAPGKHLRGLRAGAGNNHYMSPVGLSMPLFLGAFCLNYLRR